MGKKWTALGSNLYRLESTGSIYVRKKYGGDRARGHLIPDLERNTKESGLGKAKSVATIIVREHESKHLGRDSNQKTVRARSLNEVIAEYRLFHLPKKRPRTRMTYEIYLSELAKELGEIPVAMITNRLFETWLTSFRKKKVRKTYFDYQKVLQGVLNWGHKQGFVPQMVKIDNPDAGLKAAGRVYSKEEIARLWEVMGEDLKDQFVLAYGCGMRLREILYLTWDRIDLKTGLLVLRAEDVKTGTQTGRGREFIVTPEALERLKARREVSGTSMYVFPSPTDESRPRNQSNKAWTATKLRAKVKGRARFHDLRHTAITSWLMEKNVPPILVSEYAGVSLATIQRVYLHSKASQTVQVSMALSVNPTTGGNAGGKDQKEKRENEKKG